MLVQKAWISIENSITCQISNWKKHNASGLEFEKNTTRQVLNLKKIQRVMFWIEKKLQRVRSLVKNFTKCQVLIIFFLQFVKFSFVHQNRARISNVLIYNVGSVSQAILLGSVSCTQTVINVKRQIKTANLIWVCSLIYLDRESYLARFYWRLWCLQRTEISSSISRTHLWWRHVLWSGRGPTLSSIEVGYKEWWLRRVCTKVSR